MGVGVTQAIKEITAIVDELDTAAYEQGKADCRGEMQADLKQARDEGYDTGHADGYAEGKSEEGEA